MQILIIMLNQFQNTHDVILSVGPSLHNFSSKRNTNIRKSHTLVSIFLIFSAIDTGLSLHSQPKS